MSNTKFNLADVFDPIPQNQNFCLADVFDPITENINDELDDIQKVISEHQKEQNKIYIKPKILNGLEQKTLF